MVLKRILYRGFRNLSPEPLEPGPALNVFCGPNAQGKTNILEAVYLLSTLGSFRTRRVRDLITVGENEAEVEGIVSDGYGTARLGVHLSKEGKKAFVDRKQPFSAAGYLKVFPTVFFGPGDMEMAKGDQSLRRKYLDRASFSADPSYVEKMKNYRRALAQRNEALQSNQQDLEPWTTFLSQAGWEICRQRSLSLGELKETVARIHRDISGGTEEIEISYKPSWKMEEGAEGLRNILLESDAEDRKRGFTHHGPHRDKVKVKLGGREISEHGSQGQHRTLVLSMKLALLLWAKEKTGSSPAFLLDDPGSELDKKRLGYLGEFLTGWKGQVFVSSVGSDDIPVNAGSVKNVYNIESGRVAKTGTVSKN
ncbi:DNA replication/repair protein RecF [bacterium]|nr:MAG: DNA replication/repair protein RecF [bacterium]